jgi:hypothetical protein
MRKSAASVRARVLASAANCARSQQTLTSASHVLTSSLTRGADILRPAVRLAMAGLGEQAQAAADAPERKLGAGRWQPLRSATSPPGATSSPPGQLLIGLSLSPLCGADVLQMQLWGGVGRWWALRRWGGEGAAADLKS